MQTSGRLFQAVSCCVLAGYAVQAEPVRIGIIGDQTYSTNLGQSYEVLTKAAIALRQEQVEAVLHTGDLVESSVTPAQYRVLFQRATGILDGISAPWHLTPGDHDVNPVQYDPLSSDRSRETLYRELYGPHQPGLSPALAHSFDVHGYHFIALNSQEHLHADVRWGDVFLAGISPEQFAWLRQDLENHRKAKGIVVWLHQPLWYQWSGWAPVHDLLRHYKVRAVVAGHFHYNQDEGQLDGVHYLVVGASGADTKPASRDAGSFPQVTLLTLTPREATFRLIPLDGGPPPPFATRPAMDRIQALDLVRGELWGFAGENAVCLREGQLVDQAGKPARLHLSSLGNPTDVPISLSVTLDPGAFALQEPLFVAGRCGSDHSCTFPPAAGIQWSNNSTVQLKTGLHPFWESGVSVTDISKAADPLVLRVRLQLPGGQFVEGKASLTAKTCSP